MTDRHLIRGQVALILVEAARKTIYKAHLPLGEGRNS